ncbi:MAG: hypothetical protein JKY51_03160 [Opitutaceae bacterium]|nr:hypothetical protein [Opitutaceae bacterium]
MARPTHGQFASQPEGLRPSRVKSMHAVLTQNQFSKARDFLLREGRPLEQQLFRHYFEQSDVEGILRELNAYQMPDGGFRRMGEGNRNASSPIGSTVAFQHLVELDVGSDHPIVQKGVDYFLSAYDQDYAAWPQNADDRRYLEDNLYQHWGNPSAEIVGYLWKYRESVPPEFLEHVTAIAIDHFHNLSVPVPGFSDLCYLRLARWILTDSIREDIYRKVSEGVCQNLQLDHTRWHTQYFIKPYWYATHPTCVFHGLLRDEINACLDFDIETQEDDGSAYLTFKVDGEAKRIWKSIWTLEGLKILKNYGRIETMRSSDQSIGSDK